MNIVEPVAYQSTAVSQLEDRTSIRRSGGSAFRSVRFFKENISSTRF